MKFLIDVSLSPQHAQRGTCSPSVIQIRCGDVLPDAIGFTALAAIRQSISDLEIGALVTVEPFKHRVRVLPIVR